ncbi:MAG: hypothetical protein WCX65_05015 [bacterium]
MSNRVFIQIAVPNEFDSEIEAYCNWIGTNKSDFIRNLVGERLIHYMTAKNQMSSIITDKQSEPDQAETPEEVQSGNALSVIEACEQILNHPLFNKDKALFVRNCIRIVKDGKTLSEKQKIVISKIYYSLFKVNAFGNYSTPCRNMDRDIMDSVIMAPMPTIGLIYIACKRAVKFIDLGEGFCSFIKKLEDMPCMASITDAIRKEWFSYKPSMPSSICAIGISPENVKTHPDVTGMYHNIINSGYDFEADEDKRQIHAAFRHYVLKDMECVVHPDWDFGSDRANQLFAIKCIIFINDKCLNINPQ